MAALYEINQELLSCVDMETGEIIDEERLNQLQMEWKDKVENIALWIKNLLSDAAGIDAECKALMERKKAAERKADSLKQYLTQQMGTEKFATPKVAISFRRSEAVEITDEEQIPKDYIRIVEECKIDKTAIKQALKVDKVVPGAMLVQRQNIQIK